MVILLTEIKKPDWVKSELKQCEQVDKGTLVLCSRIFYFYKLIYYLQIFSFSQLHVFI